jgi:hypothetical protein
VSIVDEAIAAAGVDPRESHAKLMAGQQDRTIQLARAFEDAGRSAREAYQRARLVHGGIAGAYTVGQAPVLDAGARDQQAWQLLGQGGQDMDDTAAFLKRAVTALDGAQAASTRVVDRMTLDLNGVAAAYGYDARAGIAGPADRPRYLERAVQIVTTAAGEVQRITEEYDRGLARDAADLAGRGYTAPLGPVDPLSPEAARRDGELLRAAVADPDAADVRADQATATLQGIATQVQSGQPLTPAQRSFVSAFADAAGADALAAIPGLADRGVQAGADRAEAALAGSLSALTNPDLGGTADVAALPAALRTLTVDPFASVGPETGPHDFQAVTDTVPRYEGLSRLLGATTVPLGTDFGTVVGQQAVRTQQFTASYLLDPLAVGPYTRVDPDAVARVRAAEAGAGQLLTDVSRNLDTAQALVGDRDFRNSLLTTQAQDATGAATLLDRATARVAPTAVDAEQNARITADLLTELAGDPYGWRDAIPRGAPVSNEITAIVAENIDAFGSNSDGLADVYRATGTPDGYYSGIGLGARDAQDVLTFVGAGRDPAAPVDPDLVRVHAAAQEFTRSQVLHAAAGTEDPTTALGQAGSVAAAVNTADFRTAMQAYGDADAARTEVFENLTTVAELPIGQTVELATGALPGWVGDGLSLVVDQAIEGFEPTETAGQQGADLLDTLSGRQQTEVDHLLVSTYEQAGLLPADAPDLDAVTDGSGRVAPLESFRDGQPDPDVAAGETPPREALGEIARNGPAGGDPDAWRAAAAEYGNRSSLDALDPDYANPEPRAPLDADQLDGWRRGDRTSPLFGLR